MAINRTPNFGFPKPTLGTRTAAQLLIYGQYLDEADAEILATLSGVEHIPLQTAAAGGSVNAITAVFDPPILALANFIAVRVIAAGANTTAVTFAPDGLAAKPVVVGSNSDLVAGNIPGANFPIDLVYLTSLGKWVMLNPVVPAAAVSFASEAEAKAGVVTNKAVAPNNLKHGIPTGSILPFGGASAPTGYLLCNGAAVSRTTYADLFAVVAEVFGAGDGVNTFLLPNLQQKFPLGKAVSGTGSTLGGTGGTIDAAPVAHSHTLLISGSGTETHLKTEDGVSYISSVLAAAVDWVRDVTNTTGGTGTYNPPFQVVNYIIKY